MYLFDGKCGMNCPEKYFKDKEKYVCKTCE